jgi:hypothetical protein
MDKGGIRNACNLCIYDTAQVLTNFPALGYENYNLECLHFPAFSGTAYGSGLRTAYLSGTQGFKRMLGSKLNIGY